MKKMKKTEDIEKRIKINEMIKEIDNGIKTCDSTLMKLNGNMQALLDFKNSWDAIKENINYFFDKEANEMLWDRYLKEQR